MSSQSKKSNKETVVPSFQSLSDLKPKKAQIKTKASKKRNGKPHKAKRSSTPSALTLMENKANKALTNNQLQIAKQHFDALIESFNKGNAGQADPIQALDISKQTQLARIYSNSGIVNARLGDINRAIADFEKAVQYDVNYTAAYSNLANAYLSTKQYRKALDAIRHALRLDPSNYNANFNHLIILSKLQRWEQTIATLNTLFERFEAQIAAVDPSPFIDIKKQVCDWSGIEALEQRVATMSNAGKLPTKWALVHVNNHALNGEQQLRVLHQYAKQNFGHLTRRCLQPNSSLKNLEKSERKIRVAYVSSDFYNHATTQLMIEMFENHDRDHFEWYAISHSIDDKSAMRERVKAAFDHFVEVSQWTDQQFSDWMVAQHIDIAVDLKGYTGSNRLGIFARGCAPIQITYIGFPGTTASPFMDYIIGDKWVTPAKNVHQFSERILTLKHCYQPNDKHRYLPPYAKSGINIKSTDYQEWQCKQRIKAGLPPDAFVLCCFNNTYKLHPSVFAIWMRILKNHPNSVLWLLADKPLTETNLRRYARKQGVDENRIIFAPRVRQEAYLSRYLLADLFVDTFAYNAHTTGSDALWVGLPMVTLAGDSFASRVGASLLDAVGLPQLITYNKADYEQKISDLMTDPVHLQNYSQYLRDNRNSHPLFDAKQIAKDLEHQYLSVL